MPTDGTGTLVPGPAVARFELRQSNPPTLLDTYTVPITLAAPETVVTIAPLDGEASEAGPNHGSFRFTRTGRSDSRA